MDKQRIERNPLIVKQDITALARPCFADDDLVKRCVQEAEDLDIKPMIGDNLYMVLLNESSPRTDELMNGATYKCCDNWYSFRGLKTALAYYAYGRIIRGGNGVSTRFGYVDKVEEYSDLASLKDRQQVAQESFSIADNYMRDVLRYLVHNREVFPEFRNCGGVRNNRIRIRSIGK